MYSIQKEWKSYRVYLPDLASWLTTNIGENYKGLSADYALTMWFEEEPTEQQKTDLTSSWDALTEEGEAAKWTLFDNRNAAVEAARTGLLTAAFDDLIAAERKIMLGMLLTDADKDALLVKFPQ
jgi:hypothetical protein